MSRHTGQDDSPLTAMSSGADDGEVRQPEDGGKAKASRFNGLARLAAKGHSLLWVVGGQAVGQICLLAAVPVLTRFYSADEIGLYQLALALGTILQPLATLRVEFVIPAAREVSEVWRLKRWSRWAQSGVTAFLIAASISCWLAGWAIGSEALLMASITMLAYSWMSVDSAILVRTGQLTRLGVRNAIAGAGAAALQIASVFFIQLIWVPAVCLLVGRIGALLLTRSGRIAGPDATHPADPEAGRIWTAGRATYAVLSGITAAGSLQVLVVYSGSAFGPAAAGYMGVAQRASAGPLALLGVGLSQYSQAALAPLVRSGQLQALTRSLRRQLLILAPLAAAVTGVLLVLGPQLATVVFGSDWSPVGPLLVLLAIPTGLQLLISPVTPLFLMLARERLLFWLQLGRLAASLALAVVFQIVTDDFYWAVGAYCFGLSCGYVITGIWLFRILRQGVGEVETT